MNEMDGYLGLYEQRSSFAVSAASASGAGAAGSVAASYETYSATGDRVVVSWIARTQRPYLDLVVQAAAAASAADGSGTTAAAAGVARIREVLDAGEHLAVVADTSCDPLEDVVAARREQGLRFSEEEMWGYLVQCLLALRALHARDVAHGCVSALRIDPVSGTVELGLPLLGRQPHAKYAPPELQACGGDDGAGAGAATERGDVYELGCVMTELLHLRNAKTVELRPARTHVGVDACFLLRKMMEEAPEDRPTLAQVLEYHAVQARLGAAAADAAGAAAGADEAQARLEAVAARERAVEAREAAVAAREARVETFLSLYRLTARQLDAVPASPAQAQLFVDYYDLDEGAASESSKRAAADADADAGRPSASGTGASPVEASSERVESAASARDSWVAADVAAEHDGVPTSERRNAPHAGPSQPPSRELSFGEDETTASCAEAEGLRGGWQPRAAGSADEPSTGDGTSSLGAAWSGASAQVRGGVPRAGVVECEVVDSGGFCTDDTATTTPARPTPQPQPRERGQEQQQEPPLQVQSWTANTTCSSAAQDGGGLSTPGGGLGDGGCDNGSLQAAAGATPPPWTHEESIAWHLQRSPERLVSPGGRSRSTPLQQCRLDEAGHVVKPWQRRSIQASLQQNMAELEDLVQRNRAQSGSRRRTRDDLLSQRSHRRRLDLGDGAASRSESMPSPAPSSPPPPPPSSEPASREPVSLSSPAPEQRGRRRRSGSGVAASEASSPPPTPSPLPEGKRRQRPSPSPRRIQLVGGPVTRAHSYREGSGGGEGAGEPRAAAAAAAGLSGRRRVPAAASHTAPNVVVPARAQQGATRAAAARLAAAAAAGGGDAEESPQDLLRRLRAERCSLMRQTSTA